MPLIPGTTVPRSRVRGPGGTLGPLWGAGLLVRLAGVRHSEDLDLLRTSGTDTATAIDDLRATIDATDTLDLFRFTISGPATMHGLTGGATVRVRARLGTTDAGNLPVDLAVGRDTMGRIERLTPPKPRPTAGPVRLKACTSA